MTTPRRRLIRPVSTSPPDPSQQLQKLRARLEKERRDLALATRKAERRADASDPIPDITQRPAGPASTMDAELNLAAGAPPWTTDRMSSRAKDSMGW